MFVAIALVVAAPC